MADLQQALRDCHRSKIARRRPLAKKYGTDDLLDLAEALLDSEGQPSDPERFERIMSEVIGTIERKSNEQYLIPLAVHAQKFGPKEERWNALHHAIWDTLLELMREQDPSRLPTAKELWKALPEGGPIHEKETDEWVIYWHRPNGKEEFTNFKGFEAHCTTVRKKFKKMSL